MSSGSIFTLYRKYPVKIANSEREDIIKRYVAYNKANSLNETSDEDMIKDIPLVLDPMIDAKDSVYDEETKTWKDIRDYSINGYRAKNHCVLKEDNSCLDKLLEWSFGSSFTCLKSEWNMNQYRYAESEHIVTKYEAEMILQACNYLLSEHWSDEFEKVLDNKWIRILADGNECCSYWKYVYRNNKKMLRDIDNDEDSDTAEWQLSQLKYALEAYLKADEDYSYDNTKTELVMVYSVW